MNTTYQVRFWEIQNKKGRPRPWGVRWITGPREHSEWYATKALANSRRSDLMQAMRQGEPFEVETGFPLSEIRRINSVSFLDFAQTYIAMKWPSAAATTRGDLVKALATAATLLTRDTSGRPGGEDLRRVLTRHVLLPEKHRVELADRDKSVVDWIERNSRPLHDLTEPKEARDLLDGLALNLDGTPAAEKTFRRKRSAVFNMFAYAVERDILTDNPLTRIKRKSTPPLKAIDPGIVVNERQARELLTAVTYVGQRNANRGRELRGFFATMYYAAARPGEALGLRESDCKLPESGWGELMLGESRAAAGKRFTDSGDFHDRRGLKHRAPQERRPVPIPPVLVRILREHVDEFGVAEDGRLFRSPNGAVVGATAYGRVWREARRLALTPEQVGSMLGGVPYSLRHACVSLWLNAGVPPTEVAARAGHSVAVLLTVYAKCLHGQRDALNAKIDAALLR